MICNRWSVIGFLLALGFASSGAVAADWAIERSSGSVSVLREGATPVSLSSVDVIKPGDRIMTGRSGRVMLVRGADSIVISPNTELYIPADQSSAGRTMLLQPIGEATFEVEKRNVEHFEIQTTFLAAVVKGTRFTVKVDNSGSSVFVERGVVEVFDFDTGQVGQVKAGQLAMTVAARGAGLRISGQGTLEIIQQRAPGRSLIEAQGKRIIEASIDAGNVDSDSAAPVGSDGQPVIDIDSSAANQAPGNGVSRFTTAIPTSAGLGFGLGLGTGETASRSWNAMRTNDVGENIAYLVVLILSVVFLYDLISNSLRRRHRRWLRRRRD